MPGIAIELSAHKSATITFSHPKGNSLTHSLLIELAAAISKTGADPNIHSIVIQSTGAKAFCAGASFQELTEIKTPKEAERFFSGFATVIDAQRQCPCPILCRVQGKAVGGALGIIAASDYCLASTVASVRLSELAIGLGPHVIANAVQRKIGVAHFANLALGTQWQDARWSLATGLFSEVHPNEDELDAALKAHCKRLGKCSYQSLVALKELCWQYTDNWPEQMQARAKISGDLALSAEAQGLMQKFLTS